MEDLRKLKAIIQAPTAHNAIALSHFLGQICWHNRMLRYMTDFATPLHVVVHQTPIKWIVTEDKVYFALKGTLMRQ